jgi:hypothetical protein
MTGRPGLAALLLSAAVLAGAQSQASAPAAGGPGRAILGPEVYFDLGINVRLLPSDPGEARSYYLRQPPETRERLLSACRNYVANPMDAQMPETLRFCAAIVAGLG